MCTACSPPSSSDSDGSGPSVPARKRRRVKPTLRHSRLGTLETIQRHLDACPKQGLVSPANEPLSTSYGRAVEECREKVQRIVNRCMKENSRYRDFHFDLSTDLKKKKGICLNHIGEMKFKFNTTSLYNGHLTVPKDVKRVHKIYQKPIFLDEAKSVDVKQGNLGNCWLMAAIMCLADHEDGIKKTCVAYDTEIGVYGFVFYRDGAWFDCIIDDQLYLQSFDWTVKSSEWGTLFMYQSDATPEDYQERYQTGSDALFFARSQGKNVTWVPLLEKAYAKAHGDYASLEGGSIGDGLEDLSGGVSTQLLSADILDLNKFWDDEMLKINKDFLFGASTGPTLGSNDTDNDGISPYHAYAVIATRTIKSGTRVVKLGDPLASSKGCAWKGPWRDGSEEWTEETLRELSHKFSNGPVFWMSYEDLIRKFPILYRLRLFRDPDWRHSQRWIEVDVLWKAEYHEEFSITLTQNSPLIITVSKPDHRYFMGLPSPSGLTFRLYFRICRQGQPNPEDYIEESPELSAASRSTSVEIPNMTAGTYSVFLKAARAQHLGQSWVESEGNPETWNEKLEQASSAFALAHSKCPEYSSKFREKLAETQSQKREGSANGGGLKAQYGIRKGDLLDSRIVGIHVRSKDQGLQLKEVRQGEKRCADRPKR